MKNNAAAQTVRKQPMRTCCGCRQSFPKKELIRIVRQADGTAAVDLNGKANGRGTYICRNAECLKKACASGAIARSLGIKIEPEVYERLKAELNTDEA